MRNKFNKNKLIVMVVILSVLTVLSSCNEETIKIGFIGGLTSKQSQLSIDARNAIEVGIEKINSEGGIDGKLLELVIKDDQGSYETALEKFEAFESEDVQFVIGPMTSNLSTAVLDASHMNLLFISPSMSTNQLTGIDDNFLRVSPLVDAQSDTFLDFVKSKDYEHLTIIYDLGNEEYTEYLAELIKSDGKEIIETIDLIDFDSSQEDLESALEEINLQETQSILMLSQATDTAFMAQKIKPNDAIDLYSVSWSMTKDLIRFGGKSIEGMHLIGVYQAEEESQEYLAFGNDFYEKFSYEPSFISIMAYDAYDVLIQGLKSSDSLTTEAVKKSILSIGKFNGLEDSIEMNSFGDSKRSYLIYEVINGEFVPQY